MDEDDFRALRKASLLNMTKEARATFVWRMEDVLEVYTRPYDPRFPQVCMDAQCQTTPSGQTRAPADATGAARTR